MISYEPNWKPIHNFSHKLTASQSNWPTMEKEAFAIYYAVQKLDQYLHESEFVFRKVHKLLKFIMDSLIQNKKIQHWTTNICSYSCKIEYIEGKKNSCADMLSCLPHRPSDSNDDNGHNDPDITDETFEVSIINSNNINPKTFAQYDQQVTDNQCTKVELKQSGYDLVAEKTKDKELLQLKEELQSGKASQSINSRYILLDNVPYYLSKADSDQSFSCTFLSFWGKR